MLTSSLLKMSVPPSHNTITPQKSHFLRFKRLNSKGSNLLFVIMNLVFVAVAVYLIFLFAIRAGSSKEVAVDNLAYEFSSMINILSGSDNEITVGYPDDLTNYGIILTPTSVIVYNLDKDNGDFKSEKSITPPQKITVTGSIEAEANVCLIKNDDLILLQKCNEASS